MRYIIAWGKNQWEVIDTRDECKVVFSNASRDAVNKECASLNAHEKTRNELHLITQ